MEHRNNHEQPKSVKKTCLYSLPLPKKAKRKLKRMSVASILLTFLAAAIIALLHRNDFGGGVGYLVAGLILSGLINSTLSDFKKRNFIEKYRVVEKVFGCEIQQQHLKIRKKALKHARKYTPIVSTAVLLSIIFFFCQKFGSLAHIIHSRHTFDVAVITTLVFALVPMMSFSMFFNNRYRSLSENDHMFPITIRAEGVGRNRTYREGAFDDFKSFSVRHTIGPRSNPSSGLPMIGGGMDAGGNTLGSSSNSDFTRNY